ncbi:TauD/TfdA family dioxygenase [Nonomuraea sp. NPDC059023]|uniref:TauD/TfdA family dioxygenase n=1 Tax=unclassified Nonomuraea TaxID=2593643 RepID=UPI0036B86D7C
MPATTVATLDHADPVKTAELLREHGAVLLRGLGVSSAGEFHQVVREFGEPFTTYRHGNSPREAVHEGVWTSTEYPAEYRISLHNELSQAALWPERLFFCCLDAADTGGATPISDGRALLATLDPEVRERFTTRGVTYLQNLHGGFGLGKSWQDTYETADRAEVESVLRAAGARFTWSDEGDLRVRQTRPATRKHPLTGEEVWFNQAEQWHVSSLPADEAEALLGLVESEEELPLHALYGDGTPIPADDLDHVREVARAGEWAEPWREGDVLVIDNMLVLHGRHAFTGTRKVLVAMT